MHAIRNNLGIDLFALYGLYLKGMTQELININDFNYYPLFCKYHFIKWFRQLLFNLPIGDSTESEWNLLQTGTPDFFGNKRDIKEHFKLSFLNEKVANDNFEALRSVNVSIAQVNARDSSSVALKLARDDIGGLELFLAVGTSVILTRSLGQKKGFVMDLWVQSKILSTNKVVNTVITNSCMIQSDNTYVGPSFCFESPRSASIISETSESDLHGSLHERQKLPVKLAWTKAIHKSQVLALEKAWDDIRKTEQFTHLKYVGLFWVRRLQDLIVESMTLERLASIKDENTFK